VAQEFGVTAEQDLRYRPSQTRFAEIARHVAELEADLVVGIGRIRHDIATARALANLSNRDRIGLAVVVATPIAEFVNDLGALSDGFIGPSQWEPVTSVTLPDVGPNSAESLQLLAMAAAVAGLPVDYPMAQAFASGLIAARCAQEAGSLEDDALRQAASHLDFTTFYGRFKIDDEGRQIGRSVALIQRQQGRKVVIWPPEQAQSAVRYPF